MKTVFGLIGAGKLANAQHLPNFARTQHAKLKTVCDLREDTAKEAQEKYGAPRWETDHKKVLADSEIDAVLIAVRPDRHAELTVEALDAGKHVYVEKPLAETVEDCGLAVEAQERSGRSVAVGFNRRFAPAYRKAKELLDSHGGAWNIYYRIADTYSYDWGKAFPPGQRVFHEICHIFDLLRWLVASEVASVYCIASRNDDEMITLKFESGCVATIMSSGYTTADMPKESMEVITEEGGLTVDNFVELQTYGWADAERCCLFPGHTHPDREYTHSWLYGVMGAEAMRAVRRNAHWMKRQVEAAEQSSETAVANAVVREYVRERVPHVNYDVDKGWRQALDHFAKSVGCGRIPENAGALDGLAAARLSDAAAQSRKTGMPVPMTGFDSRRNRNGQTT